MYRSLVLLCWVESLDSGKVCQFFCVKKQNALDHVVVF